jgi:dienelactone hydrolase
MIRSTRGWRALCLVAGLAVPLLAACATGAIRVPYAPTPGAPPARAAAPDPFAYERRPVAMTNHVEEEGRDYTVRLVAMPSVGENGQEGNLLTSRYYQSKAAGRRPLVIVVPIWGGSPYPSTMVARDLVSGGRSHVLLLLGEQTVIDWEAMGEAPTPDSFAAIVGRMIERVRTSIIDLRRLMDWAEGRPEVDPRRIGLIGFSESTMQVTGVLASDPRPAAAVVVMGGARFHEVMATCYGGPGEVRTLVTRRFGWSPADLARALAPLMAPIDPDHLGSRVDPARVLLVEAQHDDCIPPGAREALWTSLGRPERISVASSHSGSFMAMTFLGGNHIRRSIAEFFARTLG